MLRFLIFETKFDFETKLERDMKFEWILERYLDQKSIEIGLRIWLKMSLLGIRFKHSFFCPWRKLGEFWPHPQIQILGGGGGGKQKGATNSN